MHWCKVKTLLQFANDLDKTYMVLLQLPCLCSTTAAGCRSMQGRNQQEA